MDDLDDGGPLWGANCAGGVCFLEISGSADWLVKLLTDPQGIACLVAEVRMAEAHPVESR